MDKEEVRVRVDDDDVLHIYAEHKAETAEGDRWKSRVARNYQVHELQYCTYRTSISRSVEITARCTYSTRHYCYMHRTF